jgi:hypothetical protein
MEFRRTSKRDSSLRLGMTAICGFEVGSCWQRLYAAARLNWCDILHQEKLARRVKPAAT